MAPPRNLSRRRRFRGRGGSCRAASTAASVTPAVPSIEGSSTLFGLSDIRASLPGCRYPHAHRLSLTVFCRSRRIARGVEAPVSSSIPAIRRSRHAHPTRSRAAYHSALVLPKSTLFLIPESRTAHRDAKCAQINAVRATRMIGIGFVRFTLGLSAETPEGAARMSDSVLGTIRTPTASLPDSPCRGRLKFGPSHIHQAGRVESLCRTQNAAITAQCGPHHNEKSGLGDRCCKKGALYAFLLPGCTYRRLQICP